MFLIVIKKAGGSGQRTGLIACGCIPGKPFHPSLVETLIGFHLDVILNANIRLDFSAVAVLRM